LMWWESYVKRILRKLFIWKETDRIRDRQTMVNLLYEFINIMLWTQPDHDKTTIKLKCLYAKITRFEREEKRRLFINTGEHDIKQRKPDTITPHQS
jgi:hypothetical protein